MTDTCVADAGESPGRSKPLTPKKRLRTLDDLDHRTRASRLAFEFRDTLLGERGGSERMGALRIALIESCAVTSAMIKDIQVQWLSGEPVDVATFVTLLNARRREAELVGVDPSPKDVTPPTPAQWASRKLAESAG